MVLILLQEACTEQSVKGNTSSDGDGDTAQRSGRGGGRQVERGKLNTKHRQGGKGDATEMKGSEDGCNVPAILSVLCVIALLGYFT